MIAQLLFIPTLGAVLVSLLPHFTAEEAKAQRSRATCPKAHSGGQQGWGLNEAVWSEHLGHSRSTSPDVGFLRADLLFNPGLIRAPTGFPISQVAYTDHSEENNSKKP